MPGTEGDFGEGGVGLTDVMPREADFRAACVPLGCFRCLGAGDASTAIQRPGKREMVRDDDFGGERCRSR